MEQSSGFGNDAAPPSFDINPAAKTAYINEKQLLQPAAADMKGRVRKTAFKWSENNKTGASFPPKHKVLMINQDDEDAEDNEEDDQGIIPKPRMNDAPAVRSGENTMVGQ